MSAPATNAARRGLTLDDLARIQVPNAPTISPDGVRIVFTVQRMSVDDDKYYSNLWMVPADGSAPAFPLTHGDQKDFAPVWSPDGTRIAFLSNRGGEPHAWIIRASGGEASKLTSLKGDIDEMAWSPDGSMIAYTFRPKPEDPQKEGANKDEKKAPVFRRVTRLHYKEDGKGFLPMQRQHVWVMPVTGVTAGEPRQLTDGDADDRSIDWSPDSAWIAFTSARIEDAEWFEAWTDVFRVPAAGGPIEQLTHDPGPAEQATFSPDGKTIAFIGHHEPQEAGGMMNMRLFTMPATGAAAGAAREVAPQFDQSCINSLIGDLKGGWNHPLEWSADGSKIYFLSSDRGSTRIYRVAGTGGMPEPLTGLTEDAYDFSLSRKGDRLAFVLSTTTSPGQVFSLDAATGTRRCLTTFNTWIDEEIELATVEEFEVRGDAGPIQAWRLRPPACTGLSADAKLPSVLHIHGGPHGMYGATFVHEFQMLAARGFVVVYSNPRGGQGYGEAFASSIKGRWGTVDYDDLMSVADEIARWPYVDPKRMGVGGGSYGGYMTNWIVGHTNRFAAGVTMRSICNLLSDWGTSDYGYLTEWYWGSLPWKNPEILVKHSPITYVTDVTTPLLILHCEQDHRCPIAQAEELYTALRYMKRTVEFVRYPEDSHGLTRGGTPSRRLDHQRRTRDWFETYLGPMGASSSAEQLAEMAQAGAGVGRRQS